MKGVAGWLWSVYCVVECDRAMVGGDAEFMVGWPTVGRIRAVELGAGVNGLQPYVDGYLQLAGGRRPFGIGGRLGLPLMDWMDHQLYARYDVPMGRTTRLMLNPALFVHEGGAGSFMAFVQGVGFLFEGDRASFTPSLALVAGRARRRTEGFDVGPVRSVFGTASLAMTFHRRRRAVP